MAFPSRLFRLSYRSFEQFSNTKIIIRGRFRNTIIHMANILSTEKQIAIIAALAEGSSIGSIERMIAVHRDTIMRLGVRIGKGCARIMSEKMRDLSCTDIQLDEIWGLSARSSDMFGLRMTQRLVMRGRGLRSTAILRPCRASELASAPRLTLSRSWATWPGA
jgi:hypothetical protein